MTIDAASRDVAVPRKAWFALAVTTLVTFLSVIDISAVNVAFPSIVEDFDATNTELSWIVSGYNIVVGALLMLSGRLADSIGRKRVFLPGVAIFGIGSLLCGLAPGVGWLIAARVVQAVGGAIVNGSSFAVMLPEFPSGRRSTAIGLAGATGAFGAVVGPFVGSILIDLSGWRGIFLINVPLCILALIMGRLWLSESRDEDATGRIDILGVIIGTAAVAMIMVAIVQTEAWGFGDTRLIALFITGLALIPVIIARSRVHPEPLLNLDLYQIKSFTSANIGVSLYSLGFSSGALVSSVMLQEIWELDIRTVGLAFIPGPLIATLVSAVAGRAADRIGHRWILGIGCLLCAISYGSFIPLLTEERDISTYILLSLIAGVGVGMTIATWSSAGLSDVPEARFGVASSTYNTLRQASYAIGIAVTITLISLGADGTLEGYRWAWLWIAGSYLLAGLAVVATFPRGSSHDRS